MPYGPWRDPHFVTLDAHDKKLVVNALRLFAIDRRREAERRNLAGERYGFDVPIIDSLIYRLENAGQINVRQFGPAIAPLLKWNGTEWDMPVLRRKLIPCMPIERVGNSAERREEARQMAVALRESEVAAIAVHERLVDIDASIALARKRRVSPEVIAVLENIAAERDRRVTQSSLTR